MGVNLLGKIKLYELAKEMDIPSKDLLERARKIGIELKSHLSVISDEDIKKLKDEVNNKTKKVTKKDNKSTKTEKKVEEKK